MLICTHQHEEVIALLSIQLEAALHDAYLKHQARTSQLHVHLCVHDQLLTNVPTPAQVCAQSALLNAGQAHEHAQLQPSQDSRH